MIGFGFMDNLVMITAGDFIDSTFGVVLGISTMTAAGFGQCFSDTAGIMSGGAVDATVSRLNLPTHGLSQEQLGSKTSRLYTTAGAIVGVLTGCLLGMSCLLFMDTDRADRAKQAKELQSIFESIMDEGTSLFHAERATLFMLDNEKKELWSRVATGTEGIIKVSSHAGIVGACVDSGELINIPDAYEDSRFNKEVDAKTGFHTRSVLVIPVKDDDGEIIGAIQMCNKKNCDGTAAVFTANDENLVHMLASHVTSFIRIVNN
jgi:putative methionine-R-sulfoxide reductase with GAF domain